MEEGHANGAHSRRPRQAVAFPKFPERLPALGPGPQRKHKPGIRARAKQQLHDVAVASLCRQEQRRHAIHQALVGRAPCAGVVPHSLARPTCRPPNQVVHYGRVASQRRGVQAGAACRGARRRFLESRTPASLCTPPQSLSPLCHAPPRGMVRRTGVAPFQVIGRLCAPSMRSGLWAVGRPPSAQSARSESRRPSRAAAVLDGRTELHPCGGRP